MDPSFTPTPQTQSGSPVSFSTACVPSLAWKLCSFIIPEKSPVSEILSIAVSDSAGLTALTSRSSLYVFDSSSIPDRQQLEPRQLRRELFFPEAVSFSPDGRYLATGGSAIGCDGDNIEIIRTADIRNIINPPAISRMRISNAPSESVWSPDGNLLAVGSLDSTVLVFDVAQLEKGQAPREIASFSQVSLGFVYGLAFAPDSRALIILYCDGTVRFAALPGARPSALLPPPKSDETAEMRLPAVPNEAVWWKMLRGSRALITRRELPPDIKLAAPDHFRNIRGSLSPDGKMLALSGESESFWDALIGVGWMNDRRVHRSGVKLFDLSEIDRRGRPILREIAFFELRQEVHSIQFLGEGDLILVATQGCGLVDPEAELKPAVPHVTERRPGDDLDLQSQLNILRVRRAGSAVSLEEISSLVQECTWLKAAASPSARTICAGAYDGYGYLMQKW